MDPGLDLDTLGGSFNSEILSKKMKKWRRQCIAVGRLHKRPPRISTTTTHKVGVACRSIPIIIFLATIRS
jgi:hypothetical protein